ncbi:hypothetical protein HF265_18050 [Rhizobium leguminosarum]|uniref:MvaI/BcnI family restriction endonuclease n=1 Tax=Rhizobium leguminosarum TaxID=384 RepID=UPI001C8FE74B|nr:MvaI/BcnI family restriction endonuclease [Rhizobium leguminosarum]MBY3030980.1 hypothetical protein [Rhizobium leguminosarum]
MKQPTEFSKITLEQLRALMANAGVKRILMKELAPNDNAKNQPYLSGSLEVLNIIPAGEVYVDETKDGNRIMKAALPLDWLQLNGQTVPAPHAKLILYPQYPEVRFSGFLRGSKGPNEILTTRRPGRLLFFGLTDDRRIVAWATWGDSALAENVKSLGQLESEGVFKRIPISPAVPMDSRELLLGELRRIHLLDWIESKRRTRAGVVPYNARNGIGYTLEAELGISNNGIAGPDFEGWEVKANQVKKFSVIPPSKKNTLLTPEPDGGEYTHLDLGTFIRRYGYADRRNVADRLNFGGDFRVGRRHPLTGLTTHLTGYDSVKCVVTDVDGKLILASDAGTEVASWSFKKLFSRWNDKHAKAVYVPGETRLATTAEYRYGSAVYLCEGTNFNLFLSALAKGLVIFDPGMKLEFASTERPHSKKRSQFRILWRDIPKVYHEVSRKELVEDR